MLTQLSLRPLDVPVALRLAQRPESTYHLLQGDLGIGASTAHGAVTRLIRAGLVHPFRRTVIRGALLEFLEHGIRYAFPACGHGYGWGVPTGHAAPPYSQVIANNVFVWADADGELEGEMIEPLYPQAVELPDRCPGLYEAVALIDAFRTGPRQDRELAVEVLRRNADRWRAEPGT